MTFHSLEDKIVKYFFKNYSETSNTSRYLPENKKNIKIFDLKQKKAIFPSNIEIEKNPPSRSAKLRYVIKVRESNDLKDFENKFEHLLNIENLSRELWRRFFSLYQ